MIHLHVQVGGVLEDTRKRAGDSSWTDICISRLTEETKEADHVESTEI